MMFIELFVDNEAAFLVVGEGVRAVEGAGMEPDARGLVFPGSLNAKGEKVFAQAATVKGGDKAEIGDFGAGFFGLAQLLNVSGGSSPVVGDPDGNGGGGEVFVQLPVVPFIAVCPVVV